MEKLKQWIAFTLVGVLAVLAAGWFLLVSPKRNQAKDLNAQTANSESANAVLRSQLAVLKAQAKDEPAQEAKIARVAAKIPDNPALPALIRALEKASDATGVDVSNLAPGAPALVVAPVAAPAAATTPTAATTATAGKPVVSAASAAAAGSLASIGVNLTITGSYFEMLEFVDQLEGFTRAFKVTGLTITPAGSTSVASSKLSATVSGNIYMAAGRLPVAAVKIPKTGK